MNDIGDKFPNQDLFCQEEDDEEFPCKEILYIYQEGGEMGYKDIINYLIFHWYLDGSNFKEKNIFQHKVVPFMLINEILFKMEADEKLQRCLEPKERRHIMRALHEELARGHFAMLNTPKKIWDVGYWWPMHEEASLATNSNNFASNLCQVGD